MGRSKYFGGERPPVGRAHRADSDWVEGIMDLRRDIDTALYRLESDIPDFDSAVTDFVGVTASDGSQLVNVRLGSGTSVYSNGSAVVSMPTASQAEAEAGVVTDPRLWTPERVGQAVSALAPVLPAIVDQITAEAGVSTTEYLWTPERVAQAIAALGVSLPSTVSQVDAEGGVSTVPFLWTPERVAQAIAALGTVLPSTVSQAAAEAGTSTATYLWTPERVAQAIAALGGGGSDPVHLTTFYVGGFSAGGWGANPTDSHKQFVSWNSSWKTQFTTLEFRITGRGGSVSFTCKAPNGSTFWSPTFNLSSDIQGSTVSQSLAAASWPTTIEPLEVHITSSSPQLSNMSLWGNP